MGKILTAKQAAASAAAAEAKPEVPPTHADNADTPYLVLQDVRGLCEVMQQRADMDAVVREVQNQIAVKCNLPKESVLVQYLYLQLVHLRQITLPDEQMNAVITALHRWYQYWSNDINATASSVDSNPRANNMDETAAALKSPMSARESQSHSATEPTAPMTKLEKGTRIPQTQEAIDKWLEIDNELLNVHHIDRNSISVLSNFVKGVVRNFVAVQHTLLKHAGSCTSSSNPAAATESLESVDILPRCFRDSLDEISSLINQTIGTQV